MPTPNKTLGAFTIKATNGRLNQLITDIYIHIPGSAQNTIIKAIWDTGATSSVITKAVATQLNLIATGMTKMTTANGDIPAKTYTVDIGLPNKLMFQQIIVAEVDGLSSGCNALIGMDIITLGDFVITSHKGTTCMSFRVPSGHEIDYVKNPTYGMTPIKNIAPGKMGSNMTLPKKKRKK
jgi:hypothetical protein